MATSRREQVVVGIGYKGIGVARRGVLLRRGGLERSALARDIDLTLRS